MASSARAINLLQGNLDQTRKIVEKLKQNNTLLKTAYDKLEKDHLELKEVHEDAVAQKEMAVKSQKAVERECEQLYKQWNDHLKNQAEEFAAVQAQMVPTRELEMLRIQMVEELEFPQRQRVAALQAEINKYQTLYQKEHRTLELLKTQQQQTDAENTKIFAEMKERHRVVVDDLIKKNRQLQILVEDASGADQMQRIERENAELTLRLKQQQEQVAAIRAMKEDAVVTLEELKMLHLKNIKAEQGKLILVEKEKKAFEQRCHDLKEELENVKQQQTMYQIKALRLDQVSSDYENKVKAAEAQMRLIKDTCDKRMDDMKTDYESQCRRLRATLDEKTNELEEASRSRDKLENERSVMEREYIVKTKQIREEENNKLRQAELAKAEMVSQLTDLQKSLANQETETQHALQLHEQTIESLRAKITTTGEERDSAKQEAINAKAEGARYRADFQASTKELQELQSEYNMLQGQHRQLLEKDHQSGAIVKRLELEVESAKEDLLKQASAVKAERQQFLLKLKRNNLEASQDRQIIQGQMEKLEQDMNQDQKQAKQLLTQLKQDKLKYKKMATHLRAKVAQLTEEVARLRKENSIIQQAKRREVESLSKQMQQMSMASIGNTSLSMSVPGYGSDYGVGGMGSGIGMYGLNHPAIGGGIGGLSASGGAFHSLNSNSQQPPTSSFPGDLSVASGLGRDEAAKTQQHLEDIRQRLNLNNPAPDAASVSSIDV